jgi:RimJ/RimL family protein N-acetyltransferase
MPPFTFRPATIDDAPLIHEWLARPHVAEWWGEPPSLAEVAREYAADDDDAAVRRFIALEDGVPIGYLQSYVAMGAGGGWWPDERDPGARGIDQFLADAERLGRGVGTAMVRAFVAELFADPAVTRVQADPSPRNARAIRCYEKAGFRAAGEVETPDGRALLMVRERDARPGSDPIEGVLTPSPGDTPSERKRTPGRGEKTKKT